MSVQSADGEPTRPLEGRTLIISGGSRGIGEAIAVRAAREGANVALVAKTADPHPKLPGTVYTAAAAVESAGGRALPIVGDIRDDRRVRGRRRRRDNASAIDLAHSEHLSMRKYGLMQDINARGTFLLTKTAIPHLRRSSNPHVLTLSPPIDLDSKWFATIGAAYTISKFSMSLVTLGLAAELRADGVAVNSLWPRTTIATSAVRK